MNNLKTNSPTNKVMGATVGAALGDVFSLLLIGFLANNGYEIDEALNTAIQLVFTSAASFAIGYLVPSSDKDVITK